MIKVLEVGYTNYYAKKIVSVGATISTTVNQEIQKGMIMY